MSTAAPRRKKIPDSIKLAVALKALGHKDERGINWSHEPALQLRAINDEGTDYKPAQLDPEFIFIRAKADHDHITFKDNGSGRGDLAAIAKSKRIRRKEAEHQASMADKIMTEHDRLRLQADNEIAACFGPQRKRRKTKITARANPWPKGQKIRSRGFQRRRT
jgi:hypothetical protein